MSRSILPVASPSRSSVRPTALASLSSRSIPRRSPGVVENNLPDEVGGFDPADALTNKIGQNVAEFLANEIRRGPRSA